MDFTRSELKKLIPIYCWEIESIDMSEYADYQFSEGYLKKKEKLIRQQKKVYYPLIKTTGRRIASAIIAAALMGTLTVAAYEPARNAVKDFFMGIFATHSDISAVNEDNDAPETIEAIYEITYDLSEFDVSFEDYHDYLRTICYSNGQIDINYSQWVKSVFDMSVNTEGTEMSTINIGDYEAIYYTDNNNYSTVIWDNREYIIVIDTNLSQNELIEIAESVQKVE